MNTKQPRFERLIVIQVILVILVAIWSIWGLLFVAESYRWADYARDPHAIEMGLFLDDHQLVMISLDRLYVVMSGWIILLIAIKFCERISLKRER